MTKIEPRIEKLFVCFAASMHLKFTAAFPTEEAVEVAKIVWQRGLAELSDKELSAGIAGLANWQHSMFPSLSEFKLLLCPRLSAAQHVQIERAPFVAANPDTAKAAWQQLIKNPKLNTKLKLALEKIVERNNNSEVNENKGN